MSFSAANFIISGAGTDKTIRFKDDNATPVGGLYVCNFKSVATEEETMIIRMTNEQEFTFTFISATEAKLAMTNLRAAVDNLLPNCAITVPVATPTVVAVPKTYVNFKIDFAANSLVANTVYQVTDAAGTLGLGAGFVFYTQFQTTNANSGVIKGFNVGFSSYYDIDLNSNSVLSKNDPVGKIKIDGSVSNVSVVGTFSDSSIFDSSLVANDCIANTIVGSNITANDINNSKFYNCAGLILNDINDSVFSNLVGDFSSYDFNNVKVDRYDYNVGLVGSLTMATSNAEVYTAFINENILEVPTLVSDIYATLTSPFTDVAVDFKIKVPLAGIGSNRTLTIKDSAATIIDTITSAHAGLTLVYSFNTVTGLFEKVTMSNGLIKQDVTVSSNGQTLFSNALPYIPTTPSSIILTVNGAKQTYSTDFTISGRSINWVSTDFDLETTDVVVVSFWEGK